MTAYCCKCKKSVDIKDPRAVILKNGRSATRGTCPECGTTVYRMG